MDITSRWGRFQQIIDLGDSGKTEEALQASRRLLAELDDATDRASLLFSMVGFYLTLNDPDNARAALDQVHQLVITAPEVLLNADLWEGRLLEFAGDLTGAEERFADLLQRNAEILADEKLRYIYEIAQCRRGIDLIGLGKFNAARPLLEEAVGSFHFQNVADEQEVHFGLAICYENMRESESAKRAFLKVIGFELGSDIEESARYYLARLYFQTGGYAQAKHQLEMILKDGPERVRAVRRDYIYEQLSHIARHTGQKENAEYYGKMASKYKEIDGKSPKACGPYLAP